MKAEYLFVLIAVFSIILAACTQSVTTTQKSGAMMDKETNEMAKIGFEMVDGRMVKVKENGRSKFLMSTDVVLNDGTKVMTDGRVVRKDGTSFIMKDNESIWMDGSFMKAGEMMEKEYHGKVLAGTELTKYMDYNKQDYDKALMEKKKILLYFYADWCPLCKKEQPETFAAFNELNDPDLTGFRVNYRDSDTDADEESLAKEFGVGYQHTKVILKDGQWIGKCPDSCDKKRYLDELARI